MRIEKRLVSKIAFHTPRKCVEDSNGNTVLILPEGEIQTYLTFDDGERTRAYHVWVEHLHGLTLIAYTPLEEETSVFRSKDGVVAVVDPKVEYEEY
jgi:hypothetical protein